MIERPYPPAQHPLPPDPDEITWDLALYLHDAGVGEVSDETRELTGSHPPIFLDDLPDAPDEAIGIYGPMVPSADSVTNPLVRFLILHRTSTRAGLAPLAQSTFEALHRPYGFRLTADRAVMYCARVTFDPPVMDQNGRWRRVDTYEARIRPRDSIYT